jgi:hypothetical protein
VHTQVPATQAPQPGKGEFLVKLLPTPVKRRAPFHPHPPSEGVFGIIADIVDVTEDRREELVNGRLDVGKEKPSFFLPKYGPYSLTTTSNHWFENTSTKISVDTNNDNEIERSEDWWSSLPIRLGDQMFDVKAVDPGGTWILLAKSSAPLAGLVVGKPCLPFTFKTTDGKSVSLADYKGKWLLLDVWSFT